MRVATSCDTIVRVCGLRARDTVETCTPARCAICLIPDGDLLIAAKIRLWRATLQVTALFAGHPHRVQYTGWIQRINANPAKQVNPRGNARPDLISYRRGSRRSRRRQ